MSSRMLVRFRVFSLAVVVLMLVAACTTLPPTSAVPSPSAATPGVEPTLPPPTGGTPNGGTPSGGMPPAGDAAAVDAARDALAVELGVTLADIRIVSIEPVDWRDGCLEVSRPDVMCLQRITPGFRIMLEVKGEQYEMRTDIDGKVVLRAGPHSTEGAPSGAAVKAVAQLASQLSLQLNDVRIVSSEYVEWPDSCLGAGGPAESCALVITPGYRIVLEANAKQYIFHTDATGGQIRPAPEGTAAGEPGTGEEASIIGWRETGDEGCVDVFLRADGVLSGKCGEELSAAGYMTSTHRLDQLLDMQAIYASFAADTPAGKIAFNGSGPLNPGPAEQRMMAEFAAAVYGEAQTGAGGAQWGLGWRREGGIAGFCDDLTIDASGHALLNDCRGQVPAEVGWRRLTEAELSQFYVWLDTLGVFEHEQKDAAVADAMTISVIFAGRTEAQPTDADKTALINFGGDVLAQWAGPSGVRFVTAQRDVTIRRGPGPDFAEAGQVAAGQTALVTGVSRDEAWWRVVCPDDTVGSCYVSAAGTDTEPVMPPPAPGMAVTPQPAAPPAMTATPASGQGGTGGATTLPTPTLPTSSLDETDEAAILASVIRRVYTVDHTFATAPNFPVVYLLRVEDTEAGATPFTGMQVAVEPALQQAVATRIADLPAKAAWVTDPNSVPRDTTGLVDGNGAIITVGNIRPQVDGSVQVAASIYIGSLAAGGQTYVLERMGDGWEITGKTGPSWIS